MTPRLMLVGLLGSLVSCTCGPKSPVNDPAASTAPGISEIEPRQPDPVEEALLAKHSRFLWREGGTLRVKAANGKQTAFADVTTNADSAVETHLVEVYPGEKLALLEHRLYEGNTHELVSLVTAQSMAFIGKPVWSKDRKAFVAASGGHAYNPDQIFIASCEEDVCRVLHNEPLPGASVTWETASRVKIAIQDVEDEKPRGFVTCEVTDTSATCTKPPSVGLPNVAPTR